MENIIINEVGYKNNTLLIVEYIGEDDPVLHIDNAIKECIKNKKHIQFVDTNMDNPWIRIILVMES